MASYAPSLLDKLMNTFSRGREGMTVRHSVDQVKDSVARDIEMIINEHQCFSANDLADYHNAARSILTLGLIDISAMSLASDRDRRLLTCAIRDCLQAHDQRLSNVDIGVQQAGPSATRFSFTIRAQLSLEPHTERVVFDVVLQPGSKRYEVSKADPRSARGTSAAGQS